MADSKISALTALGATPASTDEIPIVDKSDTSQAASGTTKRVTYSDLISGLSTSADFGNWTFSANTLTSDTTGNASILTEDATGAGSGPNLLIQAGDSGSSGGNGGNLTLEAGASLAGGTAGAASISSGSGSMGASSGTLTIQTPDGDAGSGTLTITTGDATSSGVAGDIALTPGTDFAGGSAHVVISGGLVIPNGAAVAPARTGEVALDTTITSHSPMLKYYDGSNEHVVIGMRTTDLTTTNNHVLKYNSGSGRIVMGSAPVTSRTGVYRYVWVGATAMEPRSTNGPSAGTVELATNDLMLPTFDFDTTTEEGVGFWVNLGDQYSTDPIKVKFYWTAASGSGTVKWDIAAQSYADDDAIDQALGTEQGVTDTLLLANDMHITSATAELTIADATAGEPVYFQITRDVATDTLGVDAKLIGCMIQYQESSTESSAW